MSSNTAWEDLCTCYRDIAGLRAAKALAEWDAETYQPTSGDDSRAAVLATLEGSLQARYADPHLLESAQAVLASEPTGSERAAGARRAIQAALLASAVPEALQREVTIATAKSTALWKPAKQDGTTEAIAEFMAAFETQVRLTSERADALVAAGVGVDRHSALIAGYEPGSSSAEMLALTTGVADAVAPLVKQALANPQSVTSRKGTWPVTGQEELSRLVATAIGYDFVAGRLDTSAHPFSESMGPGDSRLTWSATDDWWWGLGSVMHEAGHGLYEQNMPRAWWGTPLYHAASFGAHESQSRFQECHVGQSRGFWTWCAPYAAKLLPGFPTDVDAILRSLQAVAPGLIRLEADEVTYDAHIAVRVNVEADLFAGRISVAEISDAWNAYYERFLGVTPTCFADGWGQDCHFAYGYWGYFGSYTVGNAAAAQLFAAADAELGLDARFAAGEFKSLFAWLKSHVWDHASRYSTPELIERATGAPLGPAALVEHLTSIAEHVS